MTKTSISIKGEQFLINGKLTYSEIIGSNASAHGLLMNARFIQGIFDDKADRSKYNRFGRMFDPEKNTDDLIAALPEWYAHGLRAFTVGFQGGGPCFTTNNMDIDNNPFGEDGNSIDPDYAARMHRVITAADEIGMVVIVSFFYGAQARKLKDGRAVYNAVVTASRFIKDGGYTNVIIEIANEYNIKAFKDHAILQSSEGIAVLIETARKESGGLLVGCSGGGGNINREISEASDVVLIHGNGCSRQEYYNMIKQIKEWVPGKPIVCNEDSHAITQLDVAYKTQTSWGYYNNATKQEPPTDWSVLEGEDKFFAYRMAQGIGIKLEPIPKEEQYYLQGLESDTEYEGKRWIRLASLYPEKINYVDFYRNNKLIYTSYDDPFSVNFKCNWLQGHVLTQPEDNEWKAVIHLVNGEVIEKKTLV